MQSVSSSVLQPMLHQYVTRADRRVVTERLLGDWMVNFLYGRAREHADLAAGLTVLWNPVAIVALQAIWIGLFVHTGWSMVTSSVLTFHVRHDRV